MSASDEHITELDGLRGLACIMVLLAHCVVGLFIFPPEADLHLLRHYSLWFLLGGVDLFFVLSGFLIGGILLDNRSSSNFFRAFWARRFARILPALYVLLATYALALLVRANYDLPWMDIWLLKEPRPPFWTYATFLQNFPIAVTGVEQPRWVGVTWSLAIEEQFYMLFPFVVYFLTRRAVVGVVAIGIVAAPILRSIFEAYYGNWYAPYILLPSRMDALLFGVAVALIMRNARAKIFVVRWRLIVDLAIVVLFYLLMVNHPLIYMWPSVGPFPILKHSALALMFALLLMRIFLYEGGIFKRILRSRMLVRAGLISYSLYLYHQSVNGMLHGYLFNSEPRILSVAEYGVAILVILISICLAALSYKYIELPIRQYGRRVRYEFSDDAARPLAGGVAR